jgi:hypothetical protein
MSAPRSVLTLASESLAWVKVSRQPITEPYICLGNKPYEANAREISGCNASEGIERRNNPCVGGRYCSFSSRQNSYGRKRQGDKSPTASKTTARYQMELI